MGVLASLPHHGEIAQLVEHTTENRGVPGSSPGLAIGNGPANQAFFVARSSVGAGHDGRKGARVPNGVPKLRCGAHPGATIWVLTLRGSRRATRPIAMSHSDQAM